MYLQDKPVKNADESTINSAVLRLQSNMNEAVGATNLQSSKATQQFMAKTSKKDEEGDDEGVFSGSLAKLGGIRALADQLEKALLVVFLELVIVFCL